MQTVRKLRKRSGFTLVELLIVIIIIGILAGAMLLLAGSGTDSAEATKIVSDLRSMKSAALMYYADNPGGGGLTAGKNEVLKLQDYSDKTISSDIFSFLTTASGDWFVGREVTGAASVKTKLKGMTDVPLLGSTGDTTPPSTSAYNAEDWAWMKAR